MGLNCKCPTSFLNDQTREFPIIILGIYTVSKTADPHQQTPLLQPARPSLILFEASETGSQSYLAKIHSDCSRGIPKYGLSINCLYYYTYYEYL